MSVLARFFSLQLGNSLLEVLGKMRRRRSNCSVQLLHGNGGRGSLIASLLQDSHVFCCGARHKKETVGNDYLVDGPAAVVHSRTVRLSWAFQESDL